MPIRALLPLLLCLLAPFTTASSCNSAMQVDQLAISPDGQRIATIHSRDDDVHLHDAEGNTIGRAKGHTEWALAVAYSPDGKLLASAAWDQTVQIRDAVTGTTLTMFKQQGNTHHLSFAPDGERLAASGKGMILLPGTGETGLELGSGGGLLPILFSRDGKTLLCGTHEGQVVVRDATTGDELGRFGNGNQSAIALALSADGRFVAFAESHDRIAVWTVDTRTLAQQFTGGIGRVPLAFHPDGRLAMMSNAGVLLYDVSSGSEAGRIPGATGRAIAFSPDGRYLYTTSSNKVKRYPVPE